MHRSGTSVTAKLAISQNKKIFALPHEIWDSHGVGTNRLIKNGAILVMNTEDILFEFKCLKKMYKKYKDIQKIDLNSLNIDYDIFENSKNSTNYMKYGKSVNFTKAKSSSLEIQLSENKALNSNSSLKIVEKRKLENSKLSYIYDLISNEPISINEICKKTSKPISQISSDLFSLELEGYIKKVAGGYICILNK